MNKQTNKHATNLVAKVAIFLVLIACLLLPAIAPVIAEENGVENVTNNNIVTESPVVVLEAEATSDSPPAAAASDSLTIDLTGVESNVADVTHNCANYLSTAYDSTYHWSVCTVCGTTFSKTKHTIVDKGWTLGASSCSSKNVHTYACSCGYNYSNTNGRPAHTLNSYMDGSTYQCNTICLSCREYPLNDGHRAIDANGNYLSCVNSGTCYYKKANGKICGNVTDAKMHSSDCYGNNGVKVGDCKYCGKHIYNLKKNELTYLGKGRYKHVIEIEVLTGETISESATKGYVVGTGATTVSVTSSINGNIIKGEAIYQFNKGCTTAYNAFWRFHSSTAMYDAWVGIHPDREAPTISSITCDDETTWSTSKTVTIKGSENWYDSVYVTVKDKDNNTLVNNAYVTCASDGTYSYSFAPNIEADDVGNTLTVTVKDPYGLNVSKTYTVKKLDNKAPGTSSEYETSTTWTNTKELTFAASDYGIGSVETSFYDETAYVSTDEADSIYSNTYEFTGDVYGKLQTCVYFKDALGNLSSATVKIWNLDNTAPTIGGADIAIGSSTSTVTITANDMNSKLKASGSGVIQYGYGTSKYSAETWQTSNQILIPNDKPGVYYFWVMDAAGNISSPISRTIYTVVYNKNKPSAASHDVTGTMANSTYQYDVSSTLRSNTYALTGWTFTGWNTKADGSGTTYANKATVSNWSIANGATITLYAQWKANTYTVTYDKNKPSTASSQVAGTMTKSTYTYDVSSNLRTNTYALTGWTFTGWNTKADGSGTTYSNKASVKNWTSTNGANIILYAQWEANTYTVKYDKNKPSNATHDITGTMANNTYTYDVASVLHTNTYALTGWTFTGWNTKADGSGTTYANKATVSNWSIANGATIQLYAQWKANTYIVTYDKNKPSTASSQVIGTMAKSTYTYDVSSNLRTNTYTLTGWTFTGWNTKADGSGTTYANKASVKNWTTTNGASITLYAQWKANTYTVTYDKNKPSTASHDVTGMMANSTYQYGVSSTLRSNTYALTGWTFTGWNTKADGSGTAYANKATVSNWSIANGATITLYAQWKANTYTVTYDKNKPSTASSQVAGTMTKSTYTYDVSSNLRTNTYTLTGWTFTGWNTKADGSGTTYSNKASVKNWTSTNGANIILYAQWEANTYTIKYDKNKPSNATHEVTGTMANNVYAYDVANVLRTNTYALTGWTFTGWNTKADGSGTAYTDKAKVLNWTPTDGATITLYAQWRANTYLIRFYPNDSGTGVVTGSVASITATYDTPRCLPANGYAKMTTSNIEYRNGEVVTKKSLFKGWSLTDDVFTATFVDKESVMNLASEQGAIVNLYAIWDDTPSFIIGEYPDRYFTLREAQDGEITEEELLSTVVVYDRETNPLEKKTSADVAHTGNDVGITLVGYQASDFTQLTADAKISVCYQVKDESGSTAYLNITVSVTDMEPTAEPIVNYTRSMSEDYYQDDAGSYVTADVGGLNEKSRWITDTYYSQLLEIALRPTSEIPENELIFKQSFSSEDMQNMRDYVNANGFGNSENPNGLQNFYNLLIN